jgi:hypothetical protein
VARTSWRNSLASLAMACATAFCLVAELAAPAAQLGKACSAIDPIETFMTTGPDQRAIKRLVEVTGVAPRADGDERERRASRAASERSHAATKPRTCPSV